MASREAFALASIELFSRLWAELDTVLAPDECQAQDFVQPGAVERVEILRLEIHLLINACELARWRMLLTTVQRYALKSTLQSVLLALDCDPKQVPGQISGQISVDAVTSAQNCLFDAIRDLGAPSPGAPTVMRRLGS